MGDNDSISFSVLYSQLVGISYDDLTGFEHWLVDKLIKAGYGEFNEFNEYV